MAAVDTGIVDDGLFGKVGRLVVFVLDYSKHSCPEVVGNMAVHGPDARIIRVELNFYSLKWHHQDGIAKGPIERITIDFNDLKDVSMQMHGMRHGGFIRKGELNALSFLDKEWLIVWPDMIIDPPNIVFHVSYQIHLKFAIHFPFF